VGYVHKFCGEGDPTKDFIVSKLLEGARRLHPAKDSCLPISLPLLQSMISALPSVYFSSFAALFRAVFLSAFFGFMRTSEFAVCSRRQPLTSVLGFQDVQFAPCTTERDSWSVVIHFRKAKNNQCGLP
jgi:hypothetical protein